jgi:glycine oxidase
MLCLDSGERLLRHVVYGPRGYLVPRVDGRLLVGATVEDVGFDKSTTDAGIEELSQAALEIIPKLATAVKRETWAGLRPFAPDGLPVIGELSGYEGVLVATAHYRNGILLAPLTAKIIAGKIVDGHDSIYFDSFGVERFVSPTANVLAV